MHRRHGGAHATQLEAPRRLFSALTVPLVIWGATRLLERTLL